ncbi:beta-lactamase-like protein [Microdochium trichocladiopsis]|uniref:Beta-lactamase-like protein n=1 Tax=Microdochium trichocladiopsis TaxID=1682393 RepID=A0A9P8Y0N9_9PEZI|nr:beta-lactamase-like protein [Microdochium trichocladiopsis]KAH7024696.1 beta-lactamase-like protein [Microdochium trichocladiopsis]
MASPLTTTTLPVPPGAVAKVSIIDLESRGHGMPYSMLLTPPWEGLDVLNNFPDFCFLVESSAGEKLLFDLGFPLDIDSFPPVVSNMWKNSGVVLDMKKDAAGILKEHGVALEDIGAVVWSHHHSDHIGDIRTFPKSTDLVVGPGFKKAFFTVFPTNPLSELHESYFEGRTLREIDFSDASRTLTIGAFRAYDFFGDGSFYLLDAPGHDHGHLAGLARTTSSSATAAGDGDKDTFIFMAGDLCHNAAELRPSVHLPLPEGHHEEHGSNDSGTWSAAHEDNKDSRQYPSLSPCITTALISAIKQKQLQRGRRVDEPFFDAALYVDADLAAQSIRDAQVADADGNVFVVMAHDATIYSADGGDGGEKRSKVEFFPAWANDWKKKGWKEGVMWDFLGQMPV